ncbi:MAG: arginine--tRNA ligase [Candidatus Thermoplasmatota archaeon]
MFDPIETIEFEIREIIRKAVSEKIDIELEESPEGKGDLTFPCFKLASKLKKPPNEVSKELFEKMIKGLKKSDIVTSANVIGPYINFFIKNETLTKLTIPTILDRRELYGYHEKKGKKIILEHTSANPTGPLHVGRARNPIIGDTLARVMRKNGYDVETQYFMNDMGKQSATLVWGYYNINEEELEPANRDKGDHFLVRFYQKASELAEEKNNEIESYLYKYEKREQEFVRRFRDICYQILGSIIISLQRINVNIDKFVWESNFISDTSDIISKLKEKGYLKEEGGAYYLDLSNYGFDEEQKKLFLTRKDGLTLYPLRDIAYHISKFKSCDIAINVLGEDHKLEAKQLNTALELLGIEKKPEVIFYSFISLPEGKMSVRKGRVVYLDDLIDEAIDRAIKKVKNKEFEEAKKIGEIVGIGAIRYNILRVQADKPIVFDWEDALNFDGNSAPFIQYAHARACSILKKAEHFEWKEKFSSLLCELDEIELIKTLAKFPKTIEKCAEDKKVHRLANYSYVLAVAFNQFYDKIPVLKAEKDYREARLALVDASKWVLRNALDTMGISAPKSM